MFAKFDKMSLVFRKILCMKSEAKVCRNFAGILPELNGNLPKFAKIQNPAVTADKLQPTPDHMTNAALLASSSARPLPRPLSATQLHRVSR